MAPANNRFGGPQVASGAFSHLQQQNVPSHTPQHQSSNSGGLPPPSYGFAHGASNSINAFAPTGNLNGLAGGFGSGVGLGAGGTGLASREAVMGFQHGALLQQQQQAKEQMRRGSAGGSRAQMKSRIRDVWKGNLEQELKALRVLVDDYPYISMDTEFPGIVARPMGAFTTKADYHYQTLRCNVDLLKVIQLGITLFNEDGESPPTHPADRQGNPIYPNSLVPCPCTWQFNFQFSAEADMYNSDSFDFLIHAGVDFDAHEKNGIDPEEFGAKLVSSGLAFDEEVRWISFHSGYDFAYLVKLMHINPLPHDESEYRRFLSIYFPSIYDIKYMIKTAPRNQELSPDAVKIINSLGQKSGLQDLANELDIKRIGAAHQAGSDSLLTGKVFWQVKSAIFKGDIDDSKYLGHVWGLNGVGSSGTTYSQNTYTSTDTQSQTPNLNGATIYNSTTQGTPVTPASSHTGLAATPVQQAQSNGGGSMGSWTPGGGGGVFGRFGQMGSKA